jgi:predicted small metal-binding protein
MVCPDRNGVYQSHLYNIGKIVTAQDDFRLDDFQNPNIHDTHFKSTPVNRYFPYDLASENWIQKTEIDDYYSQMATVLDCAFQILKPEIKSYPESKYGFEVFGCDFMITTDNVVKLLEINARHDYGVHDMEKMNSEGFVKFCEGFYDWVYNTAIAPIFD